MMIKMKSVPFRSAKYSYPNKSKYLHVYYKTIQFKLIFSIFNMTINLIAPLNKVIFISTVLILNQILKQF